MNAIENAVWRILSWALTISPVTYLVLRLAGVIDYPHDGLIILFLVTIAFISMTARKMLDE